MVVTPSLILLGKAALAGLLFISGLAGIFHASTDSTHTPPSLLLSCAERVGDGYNQSLASAAQRFVADLQLNPSLNQTISQAIHHTNHIHQLLRALPPNKVSGFEDCAGIAAAILNCGATWN